MTEDVFLTQCLTQLSRLTCGSPQHVKINTTPLNEVLAVVCVSSPQPWRRHPRGEGYQGQAGRSEKTPDTNRSGGEAVVSLKIGPKSYYAGKRSHVSECLIEARGKTHLFCSASIKQLESPQVCLPHSGIVGDGAARPLLLFSWLRKKKKRRETDFRLNAALQKLSVHSWRMIPSIRLYCVEIWALVHTEIWLMRFALIGFIWQKVWIPILRKKTLVHVFVAMTHTRLSVEN